MTSKGFKPVACMLSLSVCFRKVRDYTVCIFQPFKIANLCFRAKQSFIQAYNVTDVLFYCDGLSSTIIEYPL
jgi:hypothetical protein